MVKITKPNIDELMEKKDVDGLINALKDGDGTVRRDVAEALGRIGDERAVGHLMQVVEDEDEIAAGKFHHAAIDGQRAGATGDPNPARQCGSSSGWSSTSTT